MKESTKEIWKNVFGCIALLVSLYFAYFFIVTVVCLDGTPTGCLYEDLGMVQLRHWCAVHLKAFLTWVTTWVK